MVRNVPVIAIDGPSGSGKGTIARLVAAWLGWHYLDSGALYRVLALAVRRAGVGLDDAESVAGVAQAMDLDFLEERGELRVMLEGHDVTEELRTESAGEAASQVARLGPVRKALLDRQRDFARPPGLVADGRDMGSTVFPESRCKVFLTASAEERTRRRHKQLRDKGINVSLPALAQEIAGRDERDSKRSASPARAAEDAYILDSTSLSEEEVFERVKELVKASGILPQFH